MFKGLSTFPFQFAKLKIEKQGYMGTISNAGLLHSPAEGVKAELPPPPVSVILPPHHFSLSPASSSVATISNVFKADKQSIDVPRPLSPPACQDAAFLADPSSIYCDTSSVIPSFQNVTV